MKVLCVSRKPDPINADIEEAVTAYLPRIFYIHMVISIYMLGSDLTFYEV
jgi:hypothetical protein